MQVFDLPDIILNIMLIVLHTRHSGSEVECRTLDRENEVTNPLHIGAVDGDSLWRCYVTTKQNHCTCTLQ